MRFIPRYKIANTLDYNKSMIKVIRLSVVSLTSLLFIAVGQFNHAVALQTSHSMTDMNHAKTASTASPACTTLCNMAISSRIDCLNGCTREADKDPTIPYYIEAQSSYLLLEDIKLPTPSNPELPGKVPIYLTHVVLRR